MTGIGVRTAHEGELEFGRVRDRMNFTVWQQPTKVTNEGTNSDTFLYNLQTVNKFCSIFIHVATTFQCPEICGPCTFFNLPGSAIVCKFKSRRPQVLNGTS